MEKMTRDDLMGVIGLVFGARAWVVVGMWDIKVDTVPPRTIILTNDWLKKNVEKGDLTPEAFEAMLRNIKETQWLKDNQEGLHYLFR